MSPEFWAIVAGTSFVAIMIGAATRDILKKLDRIVNLLFDIKIGRRD